MRSNTPRFDTPLTRRAALAQLTAALGLATGVVGTTARANDLRVGERAPPATLVTLDGQKLSTADLVGNVVILTFWATWCSPCRDELPLLSKYATEHSSQGLRVLGFSLDLPEEIGGVREVAQSLSFPNGLLANSSAPGYGRIWRLPVSFTIDRDGRLVDDGWKDKKPVWTPERLASIVTPLLATPTSVSAH
jgi:cytochrome c biogenesis protein CcmG, thiol:disulfide interchange protein DsbE